MKLRIDFEQSDRLFRLFNRDGEIAYLLLAVRGLCATVEFPSDWHESPRAWVRLGFGLFTIAFSFPWRWVVPDEYQCSGPKYGFVFFGGGLHLHWGKCKGKHDDPVTIIGMPWEWRYRERKILSALESHPYTYNLRSGEIQERIATIMAESMLWTRPWIPRRRLSRYIDVKFNDEVGEQSGSWKGGVLGCGYEMLPNETPLDALRRMERERVFS